MSDPWSALRIGDRERQEAVELLGEHYALGRLTREEHDERSDAVMTARTRGDLVPLFADLPASGRDPVPGPAGAAGPARPSRRGLSGVPGRSRWHGVGRFVVPALVVLAVLTVLTHLPLVLLALVLWWFLAHRRRDGHGTVGAWGTGYPQRHGRG